jgi:D-alanine-D-alanine ligase
VSEIQENYGSADSVPDPTRDVVILYGGLLPGAPEDEADVLEEIKAVSIALRELGWQPRPLPLTLDLGAARDDMASRRPRFVFNLVESVEANGQLISLAPALLDFLRIPYTGAPCEGMFLTSNKILAKGLMATNGIATPPWVDQAGVMAGHLPEGGGRAILKSIWEHASVGVDEDGVTDDGERLRRAAERRHGGRAGALFAESFIDGREFNLSVIGSPAGPEVLPPAEIIFQDYPEEKLRIVDYRAKWVEDSFEYNNTPRTFTLPPEDASLLVRLKEMAAACWRLFGLRGYARVDFRVDAAGKPWVLEVNANPCIAPWSGFTAAAAEGGLPYAAMIERIVRDAGLPGRPE